MNGEDWAWRRWIRNRRPVALAYRIVVGVVGVAFVILGLLLVPLPGPGWLVVIFGLVILASEFAWAHRLVEHLKVRLRAWNDWVMGQHVLVRVLIALATAAFVVAALWCAFKLMGIPPWLPHPVQDWLHDHGHL